MADTVRFMMYRPNLLRESERAAIYFPSHMDEVERMFLLMAILQTEMHRQAVRCISLLVIPFKTRH
jgi:hypothetical protein